MKKVRDQWWPTEGDVNGLLNEQRNDAFDHEMVAVAARRHAAPLHLMGRSSGIQRR